MKLHLPKMLTAALLAAITAVGSSAFADELTEYTTTNTGGRGNSNFNAYGYIITLNGSRLATTPSDVPITTYDRVNLVSVTANLRYTPGGGVNTGLALTDSTGKILALSTDSVSAVNTDVTWNFAEGTTVSTDSTLYFLFYKTNNANIKVGYTFTSTDGYENGGGSGGVYTYPNGTDITSCTFVSSGLGSTLTPPTGSNKVVHAPYISIVTTGPVAQDEYTWNVTSTPAYWDEEATNWTLRDVESEYTSGVNTIVNFNDGDFAKEVTVVGAIEAGTVKVGASYKFTVGSGDSLSIDKLSVAADKEVTVAGEGSVALTKVILANGATINMGAAASLAVTVADDADNTAIKATKDITLTSLAGPADGKVLTISAEGHTVAVQGNNTFAGDLVVAKGTVKLDSSAHSLGAYNGKNNKQQPAEAPDKTITVNEGGTIDLNGKVDQTYIYTLAGGSLVNNGANTSNGSMQTVGIELEANSTIGGTGNFYLLGPGYDNTFVTLNEHKLTKTGANSVGFRNTAVSSGTIEVQQGNIEFIDGDNSSLAANIILAGGTISGTVRADGEISVTAQQETTLNGLTVRTGKVDIAGTVNVSGGSLDLSNGNKSTGTIRVSNDSVLNVASTLWLCSNSKIEVEGSGDLNIAGLSITAPGGVATLSSNGNLAYGTGNANFTIANADITATAAVTIGNVLTNVGVYTGAHAVTLNATADSVTVAEHGTINFGTSGATGAITVKDGGIIGTYAKSDTGATTITSEGTAVLKNAIALNAGSLTMTGTYSIDDLDGEIEVTDYVHGEHADNGFAVETGTIEFVTVAPESEAVLVTTGAQIMRGGNAATVVGGVATVDSTNYATFHITNLSETVTQAKSQEEESHVTLTSIHVDAGAELTVDQNIDLSLVSAEAGAKLNILSGKTVSVGDATTTATIAGAGTYALKSGSNTMTGTLAEGSDWTGTVRLSDVSINNINLNNYGHEGSKVEFNGVTGYFLQSDTTVFAPKLVLEGEGLKLNDGFSTLASGNPKPPTKYTFAGGVSGEGNMTFSHKNGAGSNVTQHLYFTGDVAGWTGSLSVVAGFTVYAQYSGEQTVNSIISRTGGTLNVEVGTGEDSSVVTYTEAITSNSLTVNAGATAYINGGLTTSTITVADGATLAISGNTTLTSAITSAGTVTLTNVALSDAFQAQKGGEKQYFVESTANYYLGTAYEYLDVVTGTGATNATGTGLTWGGQEALAMAAGQVKVSDHGTASYDTLYIGQDTTTAEIALYDNIESLTNIVVKNGKLTVAEGDLQQPVAITVSEHGTISGDVAPEEVEIGSGAIAEFTKPVETEAIRFSAAEDGTVKVTNNGDSAAAYSMLNTQQTVEAKTLELLVQEMVMVANDVAVNEIVNAQAGGVLSLTNAESVELKSMTIGEGAIVQMTYKDEEQVAQEGTVTITESLVAGGGTLYANLTLVGHELGAETPNLLYWDLNGAGENALTLGSTLKLDTETGLIQLDNATMQAIAALETRGDYLELVLDAGTGLEYIGDGWFDGVFSRTYTNADGQQTRLGGDYNVQLLDNGNFGIVKFSNVPEPTTGTLSLLALAALAARRRKH